MAKAKDDFADESSEDQVAGAAFENEDDGLVVDLSNVEAMKFEVLAKGTYNGVIEDLDYELSKSSNKPMWNMKLAVTDEGEFQNRKQFTILSFSEKALPGTKTAIQTFAPELADKPFNPKDADVVQSLIGRPVKFKIKHEMYNDEPQSRIARWMVPDGAAGDGFMG